jgi:hypothetical protein
MGKYLLNKETQKIELHFSKSEYLALAEDQKQEIKSNFLFSKFSNAWVSRSIHYHYRAEQIAQKLGLEDAGSVGERLTYSEELERKADRAEARAERYETYSDNAEARAKLLSSALDKYRGDIAFFTQPIIAGHAGSRAFANYRERLYKRVEKGYEEYKKSEYYQDRAATARATADNVKLKDKVYLDNKIKECKKTLRAYQEHIVEYENKIYRIQQGEVIKSYKTGEPLTVEYYENLIEERLERYDYEQGKQEFFEDCLSQLGGIGYSKANVKVNDLVKIRGSWGKVLSANPTTVRILNNLGWDWMKYPYSEIQEHKPALKEDAQAI